MPIRTYQTDGDTIFDSNALLGGVCIGLHVYAAGATGVVTYPALAGGTVRVVEAGGYAPWGVTIDTALGYPRMTVSSVSFERRFSLWVTDVPTITQTGGIFAKNSGGGAMVLTPNGFGLYYVGMATLHSTTATTGDGTTWVQGYKTYRITSVNPVVPVLRHDSTGEYWGNIDSCIYVGSNVWEMKVYYHHNSTVDGIGRPVLGNPQIYCFARPTAIYNATGPRITMHENVAGSPITWDLFRPQLLIANSMPTLAAGTDVQAISNTGIIGIVGGAAGYTYESVANGGGYLVTHSGKLWRRSSTTQIHRSLQGISRFGEDAAITLTHDEAATPIVVNLTGIAS